MGEEGFGSVTFFFLSILHNIANSFKIFDFCQKAVSRIGNMGVLKSLFKDI